MVQQITRDEFLSIMKSGKPFKLVDVLDREHYEEEHIKGALSLPLAEIGREAKKILKKDDMIVVYCAGFDCEASTFAANKLLAFGYINVLDYKGGLEDYKKANLPVEGTLYK